MNQVTQLSSAGNQRAGTSPRLRVETSPTSALWLVNPYELADLRAALARGQVPFDLRDKLAKLQRAGLIHHFIEQNSQLLLALLLTVDDGSFHDVTPEESERLLRVLAYVRKDDDLVPDYQTGGYADDHLEVRLALRELAPVIEAFKLWRLRHQVPALWSINAGNRENASANCRSSECRL
jgi:hypothetical protein